MKPKYWWLIVITSVDYYTMYDGAFIVRGHDVNEAIDNAKVEFAGQTNTDVDNCGFGKYRNIEVCFKSNQKIEKV